MAISHDEIRVKRISAMGEPLGETHYALSNQVLQAHLKWYEYRALFGENPKTIDLFNEAAGPFFSGLQHTMWDDVLLRLSRLTDRDRVAGKSTLTLRRLPSLILVPSLRTEVERLVTNVLEKCEFARQWRNRQIAHTELPSELDQKARPLPDASRQYVEEALATMRALLNRVQREYEKSTIAYEMPEGGPGGVQSLLNVLRRGVKARRDRFAGL